MRHVWLRIRSSVPAEGAFCPHWNCLWILARIRLLSPFKTLEGIFRQLSWTWNCNLALCMQWHVLFHLWGIYVMFLMTTFHVGLPLREMPIPFLGVDLRLTFWVLFHCPDFIIRPWYDIGSSMNFLVFRFFIYKTRLLQPCGRISNVLSNTIQLSAKAQTRIRGSQHLKDGKRLAEEVPGLRLHLRRQNSFQDGRAIVTWLWSQDLELQPIVAQYIGFLQPYVCDSEDPQFLTPGKRKMSSLMWLVHEPCVFPWNNSTPNRGNYGQTDSVFTLSVEFIWCTHSLNKQLLSSSWVSVTVPHSRAVATRKPHLCTAHKACWEECSQRDLFTCSPQCLSVGAVFWISMLHFNGCSYCLLSLQWYLACNSPTISSSLPCKPMGSLCVLVSWGGVGPRNCDLWVWCVLLLDHSLCYGSGPQNKSSREGMVAAPQPGALSDYTEQSLLLTPKSRVSWIRNRPLVYFLSGAFLHWLHAYRT